MKTILSADEVGQAIHFWLTEKQGKPCPPGHIRCIVYQVDYSLTDQKPCPLTAVVEDKPKETR